MMSPVYSSDPAGQIYRDGELFAQVSLNIHPGLREGHAARIAAALARIEGLYFIPPCPQCGCCFGRPSLGGFAADCDDCGDLRVLAAPFDLPQAGS